MRVSSTREKSGTERERAEKQEAARKAMLRAKATGASGLSALEQDRDGGDGADGRYARGDDDSSDDGTDMGAVRGRRRAEMAMANESKPKPKRASASSRADDGDRDYDRDRDGEGGDASSKQSSEPIELLDLNSIRVPRQWLEKWAEEPFFNDAVKGCFVRLGVGGSSAEGGVVYKVCEIESVVRYKKVHKLGMRNTQKALILAIGTQSRTWRMDVISNHRFTEVAIF